MREAERSTKEYKGGGEGRGFEKEEKKAAGGVESGMALVARASGKGS